MLSLIFAYPYHYMYKFLRGKHLVQFVLILVLISSFAFLYRSLLDVFIALVNLEIFFLYQQLGYILPWFGFL